MNGTTYSKLIAALKKANIALDRKILADLARGAIPTRYGKVCAVGGGGRRRQRDVRAAREPPAVQSGVAAAGGENGGRRR